MEKKECGQCSEVLPIEMFDKSRNHYTSKCKDCRKVYAKEYRNRPDVKEKSRNYHKDYMKDAGNREATNRYNRERNKLSRVKEQRNKQRREWALAQKKKAIEYKGGECVICGYKGYSAAMDFHHLDPKTKEGLKQHKSFESNKEELDKCVLVCSNCHRGIHSGEVGYG